LFGDFEEGGLLEQVLLFDVGGVLLVAGHLFVHLGVVEGLAVVEFECVAVDLHDAFGCYLVGLLFFKRRLGCFRI